MDKYKMSQLLKQLDKDMLNIETNFYADQLNVFVRLTDGFICAQVDLMDALDKVGILDQLVEEYNNALKSDEFAYDPLEKGVDE